jgi:hypothetical protein
MSPIKTPPELQGLLIAQDRTLGDSSTQEVLVVELNQIDSLALDQSACHATSSKAAASWESGSLAVAAPAA